MKIPLKISAGCLIGLIFLTAAAQEKDGEKKSAPKIKQLAPVKCEIRIGDKERNAELVGRGRDKVYLKTGGKTLGISPDSIEAVDFEVSYIEYKVQQMEVDGEWVKAANAIVEAFKPTLPYLDLYENNAVRQLEHAAELYLRAARDFAKRGLKDDAEREYKRAYAIYGKITKAEWHGGASIAELKMLTCLMALDKYKLAGRKFKKIDEPMIGDIAFGLYYMIKSKLLFQRGELEASLDAATKSIAFETKDIDSFPEALLMTGQCQEDMLLDFRARDIYYAVAVLFQNTDIGDDAFNRLKFMQKKCDESGAEKQSIEKEFFDTIEDIDAKVKAFIERKEKEDRERAERERRERNERELEEKLED